MHFARLDFQLRLPFYHKTESKLFLVYLPLQCISLFYNDTQYTVMTSVCKLQYVLCVHLLSCCFYIYHTPSLHQVGEFNNIAMMYNVFDHIAMIC